MKLLIILFTNTILLNGFSAYAQYSKWIKDTSFKEIEFEKIRFRNDGNEFLYAHGILKQNTKIEGFPCYREVTLSKNGNLIIFILSEDFKIAGNIFKKNTQVHILENNDFLIHCLYNPTVQKYKIRKTNYNQLLFMGSTNFQLFSNGNLKFFQPVNDLEIDGIWCKPSPVRGGVTLYENGKLKECTSAKEQIIQDKKVEKNFTLKFSENGTLDYAKKEKIFGEN